MKFLIDNLVDNLCITLRSTNDLIYPETYSILRINYSKS